MTPKRGDEVAPPPIGEEWQLRFGTNEAAKGWGELAAAAPANARRCFEDLRSDPLRRDALGRQHQLHGRLSTRPRGKSVLPPWEYEVTSSGRVRYLVDEEHRTVYFVYASPRHPKDTE